MKLLLAALMTVSSFANTYELSTPLLPEFNQDYAPLNSITLNNIQFTGSDIYQRSANFTANLNGSTVDFEGFLADRLETQDYVTFFVEGNLQRDLFSNGACSNYEEFSYDYTAIIRRNKLLGDESFTITGLSVVHQYSWDKCHAQITTSQLNYTIK